MNNKILALAGIKVRLLTPFEYNLRYYQALEYPQYYLKDLKVGFGGDFSDMVK